MPKHKGRILCDHCGRRIGNAYETVTIDNAISWVFCGDRRACRIAARETLAQNQTCVVMPPRSSDDMDTAVYGAALAGFDYVTLPWWMRWLPDRWLDDLRREVAVKIGGIVERRCSVNANGLENDDD